MEMEESLVSASSRGLRGVPSFRGRWYPPLSFEAVERNHSKHSAPYALARKRGHQGALLAAFAISLSLPLSCVQEKTTRHRRDERRCSEPRVLSKGFH